MHATDDPTGSLVPWQVATARCGAHGCTGFAGAPRQCSASVTHAGLRVGGEPLEAWLAFSCTAHSGELIAARELLDRDRAVRAEWTERERRALAGLGWSPPRPLATGAAARALVRAGDQATRQRMNRIPRRIRPWGIRAPRWGPPRARCPSVEMTMSDSFGSGQRAVTTGPCSWPTQWAISAKPRPAPFRDDSGKTGEAHSGSGIRW